LITTVDLVGVGNGRFTPSWQLAQPRFADGVDPGWRGRAM